ncbi:MAG: hypothetical protein IKZ10_06695 [Akkermansia sp.]|nr:hypothetical protein [Akkermansia sp.]
MMNTYSLFSMVAALSMPVAAVYATPEQDAVARLQTALACDYITDVHYEIPQTDAAVQADAVTLYRYVRRQRRLPAGVSAQSELGQLLKPLLSRKISESDFAKTVQKTLMRFREYKLDEIYEQNSFFGEAELPLSLYGDEDSVTITFDTTGQNPPTVQIERAEPVNSKPYEVTLCFTGRVALEGDTRATLVLDPRYSLVVINRADDRFSAELAKHFGRHCRYVTYMGGFDKEQADVMELTYTPDGSSTAAPARGVRSIPVYIRLSE